MSNPVRKYTRALFELVEEGVIEPLSAFKMCVAYMSEDDVEDMCRINDISDEFLGLESDED